MDVTFANPAGFLALLGVPAVLAIHFLQRESRRCVTNTLFLLERLAPVSASGRRLERLRNSLPLWLQIAAIILLAWILAGPRWLRPDAFQSVTVVLDSSVSMEAFRPELRTALEKRLGELSHAARRTEWRLMESDPARPVLYAGANLPALLAALDRWSPGLGGHDPRPALAVAQGLQRGDGIVVFATDHDTPLPAGVDLLAVGHPLENCGFAGLRADADEWSALVVNFSDTPQTREWGIETVAGKSPKTRIDLAPGEARTLRGRYPAERPELVLSGDQYSMDDRLPIVRPHPKTLRVAVEPGEPFFERFAKTLPDSDLGGADADLRLHVYNPLAPAAIPPRSISEVRDPAPTEKYVPGTIVAENHPLTRGLNWQGLLVRDTLTIPSRPGDEVLVWAGARPLIFLRGGPDAPSLVLNFHISQSNADRLPSFIVLLSRFAESMRAAKVAKESVNVEMGQALEVASVPGRGEVTISGSPGQPLRAPTRPGFFEVKQGTDVLVEGAAHFADARDSDFRQAANRDDLAGRAAALVARNSREDFLTPWFLLALVALCLAGWALTAPPDAAQTFFRES
jgi:hypothetical protein